jgi:hypothetical protein
MPFTRPHEGHKHDSRAHMASLKKSQSSGPLHFLSALSDMASYRALRLRSRVAAVEFSRQGAKPGLLHSLLYPRHAESAQEPGEILGGGSAFC